MLRVIASFGCGPLFAIGLLISGMTDSRKILGFLDLFGASDPTLAFVMAGAVAVTGLGFALARRRSTPILTERSVLPTQTGMTARLLIGSGLFGIGWRLVALCPGPALVNLAGLNVPVILFVTAMAAGMSAGLPGQTDKQTPRRR